MRRAGRTAARCADGAKRSGGKAARDGVARGVVERDRDESPARDEPDRGQDRPSAGQDRVVGTDDVDRRGQRPAPDESPDAGNRLGVAKCEQAQATRRHALSQPGCGREADHPPYGGLFDEVIAHLTVVEGARTRPPAARRRRGRGSSATCRSVARADRLELWRQAPDGRWRPHWRLRLGLSRRR